MKLILFLTVAGFCGHALCQQDDTYFWMSYLRSYWLGYSRFADPSPQRAQGRDCPLECECPPNFPIAMYCDSRKLKHVPFVPSRMKYAYLQNNRITFIQEGVFDNATGLVWIMLHRNQLTDEKIGENVFAKIINLERLYLDQNNLTVIPSPLPSSLKDLRLSNNKIAKIPTNAFEGMENLTSLILNNNQIEDIGGSLKGLQSLTLLDLSNNYLKKLPEQLPGQLHQLYLEFNSINTIPNEYFRKLPKLQFARLSNNNLTDEGVPSNAFNVSSLIELDLSYNKLQKIPPVNSNLENLYLHANQIKEFSLGSFCKVVDIMNFSRLRVLRLDGNSIPLSALPPETALCLRLAAVIDL
ncbi:fibromodulin a [Erpetoichthys calabaricus]|uniref:fibromodulin a n=1 Tax=Erpetoichthys calabaricus TaxID=27687 RepID=UPI0022342026|nr:fibromodulin a [Erpetoichthys calabaricus]